MPIVKNQSIIMPWYSKPTSFLRMLVRSPHAIFFLLFFCVAGNNLCSAAYLAIYGGPTYSQTTGGYLSTVVNASDLYQLSPATANVVSYGAVNNDGVAIGSVDTIPAPLTSTNIDVYPSVATWSATSSPVILNSTSPTSPVQAVAINDSGTAVGSLVAGLTVQRTLNGSGLDFDNSTNTPVLWNVPNPSLTLLDDIGPGPQPPVATPFAINAHGTVVGAAAKYDSSGTFRGTTAVRWDAGSTSPTPLGTGKLVCGKNKS